MPKITSLDELNRLKVELVMKHNQDAYRGKVYVSVGLGTCGVAAGAMEVFDVLEEEIRKCDLKGVVLSQTGCIGLCSHEPLVEVAAGDAPKVSYGRVTPEIARRIVQEHILDGKPLEDFVVDTTPFPTI
jgi:NADP-reducing hydrogenase subunit HndB